MQLELFPIDRERDKNTPVLTRLTPDERIALIRILARLIIKTIRPQKKGARHER